jgi:hypothetical protein
MTRPSIPPMPSAPGARLPTLRGGRIAASIVGLALVMAAAACLLPDDPYQRWQSLHGTVYDQTRWIYERCHFDPTPIDVAILDTSRTRQGVSAPRLERDLAQAGDPLHVVNFSVVSAGRGADYAILRELLRDKHPRLVIFGIAEGANRDVQPAYRHIASASTIATALAWRTNGWLSDLAWLPYRQLILFADRLAPGVAGLPVRFDAARYAGSSVETTGAMPIEGTRQELMRTPAAQADLAAQSQEYTQRQRRVGGRFAALAKLRTLDNRAYAKLLVDTARAHGAQVAFLYMPYYEGPATPKDGRVYAGLGPIWSASFIIDQARVWSSAVHVTADGARQVTDWLAPHVAAAVPAAR